MKKVDKNDPAKIAFLVECIKTESTRRVAWIQKNSDLFYKAAVLNREPKNHTEIDIIESVAVAGMPAITRDHIAGAKYKFVLQEKYYQKAKKGAIKTDFKEQPNMLPVKPTDRELLFESKKRYLEKRGKLDPEEKYKFVESENWVYGWQLGQSFTRLKGPAYGKKCNLKDAVETKVGLQRDPDYYETHEIQGYDKCTEMAFGLEKK